jgi:hypothetical protein
MTDTPLNWPQWETPLAAYPEHVRAIGFITIEISTLEIMLGDLLAALLDLDHKYGHIIYFTPKAAMARVDMIVNLAASPHLDVHKPLRRRITSLCDRVRGVMGKRNDYVHNGWTVANGAVARIPLPMPKGESPSAPVDLQTLNTLVRDIRTLVRDTRLLIDEICAILRPGTWPEIRARLEAVLRGET